MVIAAALFVACASQSLVAARQDRIAFHAALNKVADGWPREPATTKTEVRALLGPPDDIWKSPDPAIYVSADEEVWCYGTKGHLSMPTLGRIYFKGDKVSDVVGQYGSPPPLAVISDKQLGDSMRSLWKSPRSGWMERDPLRLIQAANLLRPLGKQKALAVMCEFERLSDRGREETWLFWLARALFEPGDAVYFPVPMIGSVSPRPPNDPSEWPLCPIILADDVPFNVFNGAFLGGVPESFEEYVRRCGKTWLLRTTPLHPPDDPFSSYLLAIKAPEVKFAGDQSGASRLLLYNVLELVRTAYHPKEIGDYIEAKDFDRLHQGFLGIGCRWDEKRQLYVRQDGSFTPDEIPPWPEFMYVFNYPGLTADVRITRTSETNVDFSVIYTQKAGSDVPLVRVAAINASTRAELGYVCVGPFSAKGSGIPSGTGTLNEGVTGTTSGGFVGEAGGRIVFVFECGGTRKESPVITP
jgi:hypothetical protein